MYGFFRLGSMALMPPWRPVLFGRAGGDVAEVGVVELDVLQEGLNVDLAEADVAFRPVVEDAEAAADGGLLVRRVGETDARAEARRSSCTARADATCRDLRVGGGVDVRNAIDLVGRDGIGSADQTVEGVAATRD